MKVQKRKFQNKKILETQRLQEAYYIPSRGDLDYFCVEDRLFYLFFLHANVLAFILVTPAHDMFSACATYTHLLLFSIYILSIKYETIMVTIVIENLMYLVDMTAIIYCVVRKDEQLDPLSWYAILGETK
jgi:hypothetical protein